MIDLPSPTKQPEFGRWLREQRQRFGINQQELATAAGMAPSTVGHIEREGRFAIKATRALLIDTLQRLTTGMESLP